MGGSMNVERRMKSGWLPTLPYCKSMVSGECREESYQEMTHTHTHTHTHSQLVFVVVSTCEHKHNNRNSWVISTVSGRQYFYRVHPVGNPV